MERNFCNRMPNRIKKTALIGFLFLVSIAARAQETVLLKPEMFTGIQEIQLAQIDGWKFKAGNDVAWTKNADVSDWQTLKPTELDKDMADANGRIEGWFKLKIKLDESFGNAPLGIRFFCWAAVDLYIDGKYIHSFGSTGALGKPYQEFNPGERLPIPVDLKAGNEHVIAFHFVDEVAHYPANGIKSNRTGLEQFIKLTGPEYTKTFSKYLAQQPTFYAILISVAVMLIFLFLLLALQNKREKFLWLIILFMLLVCISNVLAIATYGQMLGFDQHIWAKLFENILGSIRYLVIPILLASIFKRNLGWDLKCYLFLTGFAFCIGLIPFEQELFYFAVGIGCGIYYLISVRAEWKNASIKIKLMAVFKAFRVFLLMTAILLPMMYIYQPIVPILMILFLLSVSVSMVLKSWKSITGAQWAIVVGLLLTFVWLVLALVSSLHYDTTIFPYSRFFNVAITLTFPLSLLVYVSLRFKEILGEVVALSEEKNEILSMQNERLEREVLARTAELHQSMEDLKSTQSQLVQSEKMASLGELTAGIAHEIQNPLNFVNNFSDVSIELLDEMEAEIDKGDLEEAKTISSDIKQNLEKINHHGKRADAIVKGMLQHSRSSTGQKEPTDINALCDEYLRLSYHGLRAKDKSFNAKIKTDFEQNIDKINVVPQEIGRVVLNLLTNAFYAVNEKKQSGLTNYEPTVSIGTKKNGDQIEIKVSDNGNGMPAHTAEKIFQPFFTTKPTGQGTGLGLSLSYDIIVKGHHGHLDVLTKENEGATFSITLPIV